MLVPPCRYMPLETLQHLADLAGAGATVLFEKSFPADVPGWGDLPQRRERFRALIAILQRTPKAAPPASNGPVRCFLGGRGEVRIGEDLPGLLKDIPVKQERLVENSGLAFLRRKENDGGWYLRRYVQDTKAKGATAIVLSPVPRKIWKDEKTIARASGDYGKWAAEAAKQEGVSFIDLNDLIARQYETMGKEKVETLFGDPHPHTNAAGAELNADMVVVGLKSLTASPFTPMLAKPPAEAKH